jgi:predicted Zn-dependent protease
VAAGAPAVLMNMRNSREMETEADSYAIVTLNQRGLPLAPLADLFEALGQLGSKDDDNNDPTFDRYISSHPAPVARSARLRAAAP